MTTLKADVVKHLAENKNLLYIPIVVLFFIPLLQLPIYVTHVFILTFLFAYLCTAWSLISGYTGQVSLGHSCFYGIGAYTTTLLFHFYNLTPWIGGTIGIVFSVIFAFKALEYAITRYGGIDAESIRKGFLDVDIPDGGTFVGFGCKFYPPDETNTDWGDNFRALFHPVCQWQNASANGLVTIWPENLAVAEPIL